MTPGGYELESRREKRSGEAATNGPFPRNYRMTGLGPLPEEWRVVRLGEVVRHGRKTLDPQSFGSERFEYYCIPAYQAFQTKGLL